MTIRWDGIEFTGPIKGIANVKDGKGVYAIMKISKWEDGTPYYQVVYFGQTESFKDRLTSNHEKYNCWKKQTDTIYRGLYFMPNSKEFQREKIEGKLINKYSPVCNNT